MDSLGFGGTTASFFGGLTMRNRAKNHGFFHGKNQHFMGRKKGKYWDVPLQ
jgi:glutamate/tyrosine decarboxylase-like PLP-dependent enzyme